MTFHRAALALCVLAACAGQVQAGQTLTLPFETHARFFSDETRQPHALDPQVFVLSDQAPAARGPQGIDHDAGLRNAWIDDDGALPLYTAHHEQLAMTLREWLGPTGTVRIDSGKDENGTVTLTLHLAGLKPHGVYSVFENHFDRDPVGFTPLDGTGMHNAFKADRHGRATLTVHAPHALTHDNAVLVVYHSDGKTYGQERGAIGVIAHHQLIARLP